MFEEEIRNKLRLSEEIRRELGIIEDSSEDELLEMGVEELQEKMKIAKQIDKEISSTSLLASDRGQLKSEIQLIKSKISRAIELWKEIRIDAELDVDRKTIETGQTFKVSLILRNRNPFEISVNLQGSWSDELKLIGTSYPRSLVLKPRTSKIASFILQGSNDGTFTVGPFTITCKAKGMEESITTEPVKVEIRSLKPILKIVKNVSKTSVREGEEIEVKLTVTNEGKGIAKDVYLRDDVSGLKVEGTTEWRGELTPGSSQTISYRIVADTINKVLKPAIVTFTDISGKQASVQSNAVNIEVQPRPIERLIEVPARREEVGKEEKERAISIDEIMGEIGKLGISALIGYSVASISPKIRRIPKKVVVDEDLRWAPVKQKDQEVTLIFEHPIAVVKDEYEEFVRLRRATPVEIFHGVDGSTARWLQEQFIHVVRGVLNSWRPEGAVEVDVEEYFDTEASEKIRKALKEYGEEVEEEKLKELPRNPMLVYTYRAKRGFLRKETLMKVYVKTYANIERLYFDEVYHAPMSLSKEVSDFIRSVSQLEHPVIVIFCSPTGWDEGTKRFAQEASDPKTHLMFIDLKTLDAYFNDKKDVLKELYSLMPKVEITYIEEMGEEVEKLDNLLLNGTLTLERYIEEIKRLRTRSISKKISE
ncbi:MAG: BatD family protein [Candidatus Bathyarchaeia archaeon]